MHHLKRNQPAASPEPSIKKGSFDFPYTSSFKMGTMIGHIAPGFAFMALGLWHLFSHTKLHSQNPSASHISHPWFNHLELYLIMLASFSSMAMELFIGPQRHQPLDVDGTIPANHLHNFEHAAISATFFVYAGLSLAIHRLGLRSHTAHGISHLLAAAAFLQQFLMFHLHSADHVGVEGQYHALLQIVVAVSFLSTVLAIEGGFLATFVRSLSILFQGIWLMVMGLALWTPGLVAKGCFIHAEEGHQVVRCGGETFLHRAKSLVNILFSWVFVGLLVFAVFFYAAMMGLYGEKVVYRGLTESEEDEKDMNCMNDYNNVESQKIGAFTGSNAFAKIGKGFSTIDMGR